MARTSTESRAEAARLYRSGTPPEDVVGELGLDVHPSTVVRWAGGADRPGPRGRTDLDDREIIRLRDEDRLPWDEIARRMAASRNAIRGHYGRAKAAAAEAGQ
jgi:hypothetical protein